MDTAADFTTYLLKRERFLTRDKPIIMATGEEQLLSVYLTKTDNQGEHDFVIPGEGEPDLVSFDESFWGSMVSNPQYLAKKKADRISYTWARLVEHFIHSAGVFDKSGNRIVTEHQELERGLRVMASEPRIRRRQLARSLIDLMEKSVDGRRATRLVYSNDFPSEHTYSFSCPSQKRWITTNTAMTDRRSWLHTAGSPSWYVPRLASLWVLPWSHQVPRSRQKIWLFSTCMIEPMRWSKKPNNYNKKPDCCLTRT